MSEIALMAHSSWQVNSDQLLPKKQLSRKHRMNRWRWMSVGATPQGMLPCSYSVQICVNLF